MVEIATIQQGTIEHNLFDYCGNEPVRRYDTMGYWWQVVALGVLLIGMAIGLAGSTSKKYVPKYTSKYNTLYKKVNNSLKKYNCYSYAIGITNDHLYPGSLCNKAYKINLETIKNNVILDLKKLKYKSKIVKNSYKPTKKETMIAFRIGRKGDFSDIHFMKRMKDGSWTHKPGTTSILKLKGNPWDYDAWPIESHDEKGWHLSLERFYDSKIYYIVYWK